MIKLSTKFQRSVALLMAIVMMLMTTGFAHASEYGVYVSFGVGSYTHDLSSFAQFDWAEVLESNENRTKLLVRHEYTTVVASLDMHTGEFVISATEQNPLTRSIRTYEDSFVMQLSVDDYGQVQMHNTLTLGEVEYDIAEVLSLAGGELPHYRAAILASLIALLGSTLYNWFVMNVARIVIAGVVLYLGATLAIELDRVRSTHHIAALNGGHVWIGPQISLTAAQDRMRRGQDTWSRTQILAQQVVGSPRVGPQFHIGSGARFLHYHPSPRTGGHAFFSLGI